MKTDEEIGRELYEFVNSDEIPHHLPNAAGYFAGIGAFARKAVGDPPRTMIHGMSVEEIIHQYSLNWDTTYKHPEHPSHAYARITHRLANTPAEAEADPDAFVKEIWERWETARLAREYPGIPASPVPFEKATPSEQAACRAVAKFLEEKK